LFTVYFRCSLEICRTAGPANRQINCPRGVVDNFLPRLAKNSEGIVQDPTGMVADDVLGYSAQPMCGRLRVKVSATDV
jgi:hypothetical protein